MTLSHHSPPAAVELGVMRQSQEELYRLHINEASQHQRDAKRGCNGGHKQRGFGSRAPQAQAWTPPSPPITVTLKFLPKPSSPRPDHRRQR